MSEARPPLPRLGRQRTRAVVVASLAGLAVAALLMWLVVAYASGNPDKVALGRDQFAVGSAKRLAQRIAEQRTPFLFKDPLSSTAGRELYVQHLGDDPKKGWLAFEAYAPDAPKEVRCVLVWSAADSEFNNPCGGGSFPPDGDGLRQYDTTVNDNGIVVVDLRSR